ncbi:hypothetical protein [Nonomuraea jabiensis]|uniref:hypothetical protein n=1 Tax=Nonomuraea jabiensis TaxID=882448 RepID=UPI003D735242
MNNPAIDRPNVRVAVEGARRCNGGVPSQPDRLAQITRERDDLARRLTDLQADPQV